MLEPLTLFEAARNPRAQSFANEATFVANQTILERARSDSQPYPFLSLIACIVVLFGCSQTGMAQDAKQIERAADALRADSSLPNFKRVSERLFRGGQPREGGLARLAALGIDTIVNLRGRDEKTVAEEAKARALGMRYFSVEMPEWGRPTDGRVARVLEIIRAPENGRVFVHCKDGVDRTGVIIACHRIAHEGWSSKRALVEARDAGMRWVQFWMRDYVGDYEEGGRARAHHPGNGGGGKSWDDRVGDGVRIGETGLSRSLRAAEHVARKGGSSIGKVFGLLP